MEYVRREVRGLGEIYDYPIRVIPGKAETFFGESRIRALIEVRKRQLDAIKTLSLNLNPQIEAVSLRRDYDLRPSQRGQDSFDRKYYYLNLLQPLR
jgi:hypothetical protein